MKAGAIYAVELEKEHLRNQFCQSLLLPQRISERVLLLKRWNVALPNLRV